jgi:hypothetical protein
MHQNNGNTGAPFHIRHVVAIDPQEFDAWGQAPRPRNVGRRRLAGGERNADESDEPAREPHFGHLRCGGKTMIIILPVRA